MKTSAVISTFNGEKYILDQLESIRTQSIAVDEVLIFDDQSQDNTVELCSNYIRRYNLKGWTVIRNKQNLGFVKNFIYGLYEATGDIIFLADQDDMWNSNKVELTLKIFHETKCLSLASTFSRISLDNRCLNSHVKHPHRKKKGLKLITLDEFCDFNGYLGMATAISKNLLITYDLRRCCDLFKSHDIILNYVAVINNSFYYFDYPLVIRRSYIGSTSNREILASVKSSHMNSCLFYCQENVYWYKSYLALHIENEHQNKIISSYIQLYNQRLDYLRVMSIKKFLSSYKLLLSKIKLRYVKDLISLLRFKLFVVFKN